MPTRAKAAIKTASSQEKLQALVTRVLKLTQIARRNRKSLTGQNHYADKIVEIRADAINCFGELSSRGVGDVSALAELVEPVFAATTKARERNAAARELTYLLRTAWRDTNSVEADFDAIFPLSTLGKTNRGYYVSIGRQMNGAYSMGWYDASAVMMRRLLEIAIIEAFEAQGGGSSIKDGDGNFFQLSALTRAALGQKCLKLSRNTRQALPHLRDVGHTSAHGRYYHAKRLDIDKVQRVYRVALEEFLHLAGLL